MVGRNMSRRMSKDLLRLNKRYEGIFEDVIRMGVEKGEFPSADTRLATLFVLGFINSVVRWFKDSGRLSSDEVISNTKNFALHGINSCR